MIIHIKRIYEPPSDTDGCRILVDRLWPRGIKKENAQIDVWMKEVAPSTELRKWIHQQPALWPRFRQQYHAELSKSNAVKELLTYLTTCKTATFLYAARDEAHNHALVLLEFLQEQGV